MRCNNTELISSLISEIVYVASQSRSRPRLCKFQPSEGLVFSKWPHSRSRIFLNVPLTFNYELPAARHRSPVVRGSSRDFSRRSREMRVVNRLGRNDREYFSLFFFPRVIYRPICRGLQRTVRKMRLFRWMYLCYVFKTVVVLYIRVICVLWYIYLQGKIG